MSYRSSSSQQKKNYNSRYPEEYHAEEYHAEEYHPKENKHYRHTRVEKVSMEPMRYKLTKLIPAQALSQIALKTSGFYDVSTKEADWIQRDIRSREFSSFGSLVAPRNFALLDMITGKDNYFLKLTTKNHGVDFIFHDLEKDEFQFWGEYQSCINAMNAIRYRIQKVTDRSEAMRAEEEAKYRDAKARQEYDDQYHSLSPESDEDDNKELSLEDKYSKNITSQMSKMGFVKGTGLGRNHTGRVEPINHISDMGGRTVKYMLQYGLGFTGHTKKEEEPVAQEPVAQEPVAQEPVAQEPVAQEPVSSEEQHVEAQHVEAQHVEAQHVEAQHVEAQHVENEDVDNEPCLMRSVSMVYEPEDTSNTPWYMSSISESN